MSATIWKCAIPMLVLIGCSAPIEQPKRAIELDAIESRLEVDMTKEPRQEVARKADLMTPESELGTSVWLYISREDSNVGLMISFRHGKVIRWKYTTPDEEE